MFNLLLSIRFRMTIKNVDKNSLCNNKVIVLVLIRLLFNEIKNKMILKVLEVFTE